MDTFKTSFARLFIGLFGWSSSFLIVLGVAVVVVEGSPTSSASTPLMSGILCALALVIASLVGAAVLAAYLKVYVHSDRLRCCDFWGLYIEYEWSEVTSIRLFNAFFGLRFIRLESKNRLRAIWLPQFLPEFDRFNNLVFKYTDPDHPLSRYLKQAEA
jgi:hypothetical protein